MCGMEIIDDKSKKRYINILRRNFLFDQADDFPKEKLLNDERAEWLSFEKGETIYGYDDYKNSLGIILKGRVSVKKDRTRDKGNTVQYTESRQCLRRCGAFWKGAVYCGYRFPEQKRHCFYFV